VVSNPNYKSWTITALDADTTTTFVHGFTSGPGAIIPNAPVAPDFAQIVPFVTYATTALPTWGVTVSTTNITLTKQGATGSGGATPGTTVIAKVNAWLPHSIAQ
jgi:hypothetical protein